MSSMGETVQPIGDSLESRNRQIAAVHTISRLLSSTLDLDDRLRDILNASMQAVDAVAGSILLYRPSDNKLVFQYVVGEKSAELTGRAMDADSGLAGQVFQTGSALLTNRVSESPHHNRHIGEEVGFVTDSIVTVPLKYQDGKPVGVMQILNKRDGGFTQGDLEVLEIVASIAAAAIENAQLHRDAQLAAVAHAVGDLSHDIKNKVAPISGWADTLRPMMREMFANLDRIVQEMPRRYVESHQQACEGVRTFYEEGFSAILEQVQEIQDYTRLIADALKGIITEPQLELHELVPIIERQLDLLEPAARKQGILLVRQFNPVPICRFDRFLIERAVYNLVNNAIPETPGGGCIVVRTDAEKEGVFPNGRYVLIEVQDNGRGMPPHVLERILRGEAKSTKPGGTGLGTRIVYNAIAAHHGLFLGESQEGVGTTFRLKIPLLES